MGEVFSLLTTAFVMFLSHHHRPLVACNASFPHAECLVSCFLVTFLFPISGMWSGARLPDNDTDCGDINAWSKGWLLLDISAGVTQAGLLLSEQNEGWLPPPPPRRQANRPHNNRVRGQWQENKPVSFSLCVCVFQRSWRFCVSTRGYSTSSSSPFTRRGHYIITHCQLDHILCSTASWSHVN